MHRIRHTTPAALFDPGWLFLLAGLALLGATAWITAANETADARIARDRLLAAESHRHERIGRYEEFLGAMDQQQPALIESLAAAQLNQIPADRAAIPGTVRDNLADASVFPALEPPALRLPAKRDVDSKLSRLIASDTTRMILLAGSALMILIGLLPPSRGWGKSQSALRPAEHDLHEPARTQAPHAPVAIATIEAKPAQTSTAAATTA